MTEISEQAKINKRLRKALEQCRQTHTICTDGWFSCPKSEEGCLDERKGDDCTCGADATNAIIDAALNTIIDNPKERVAPVEVAKPVGRLVTESLNPKNLVEDTPFIYDTGWISSIDWANKSITISTEWESSGYPEPNWDDAPPYAEYAYQFKNGEFRFWHNNGKGPRHKPGDDVTDGHIVAVYMRPYDIIKALHETDDWNKYPSATVEVRPKTIRALRQAVRDLSWAVMDDQEMKTKCWAYRIKAFEIARKVQERQNDSCTNY